MKINTTRFGEIEINTDGIVVFKNGLPGFDDLQKFVFIQENQELPFAYMQSVEDGTVCFIIVNPFVFLPDYEFEIPESDEAELKIETIEDLRVYSLLSAVDTLETATVNLVAPLIINFNSKLGKQIILHNSDYSPKHPLLSGNGG